MTIPVTQNLRTVRVLGIGGSAFLVVLLLVALFAPWVSPYDPNQQDLGTRFARPFWSDSGSLSHPLGTDQLGRDTLSRLIFGARASLLVSLSAVAIGGVAGTSLGLLGGYAAGRPSRMARALDWSIMSMTEIALAIPGVLLAIAVAAVFGTSIPVLILILSLFGWVVFARLARGILVSLHGRAFVEAATVLGASRVRIVLKHMLPHVLPQIVVVASLQVGFMILVESSLGYLGLGVPPPTPTWGNMVSDGRTILGATPWVAVFSGLAITLTILSINFMSDLMRSHLASEQL